jgi:hypothetical protein
VAGSATVHPSPSSIYSDRYRGGEPRHDAGPDEERLAVERAVRGGEIRHKGHTFVGSQRSNCAASSADDAT